MKQGDNVLIWGASGGLGSYATQFALNGGANPVCVVSSPEKAEICRAMGAELIIDRTAEDYRSGRTSTPGPARVEAVRAEDPRADRRRGRGHRLRAPGPGDLRRLVYVTRKGGTIVTCASTSGYMHEYDNRYLWMNLKRIIGSHFANYREAWEANRLIAKGKIHPTLSRTYRSTRPARPRTTCTATSTRARSACCAWPPRRAWACATGEVGRVGVPVSHLGDMRRLFQDIPLERMNTSMTINATAMWLLALYQVVAEEHGADAAKLQGTTQNDIVKEYLSRGTHVFPPGPSLRLTTDMIAYTVHHIPKWNPINICSYHLQEAGATPVQEIAYAMSTAIAVLDAVFASGQVPEERRGDVVARISFFVNAGVRFIEEMCKMRAFGRIWDRITRERYGIETPDTAASATASRSTRSG
jgi:hypothetical protein